MSLIGRFEHLPGRPQSDEARPLLEKIASQVKPIMAKRGWTVGTLAEFLPRNPALLGNNMNRGQRINLRLRPPGNTAAFYEYEQLVLVMLHELTHIVHGPHDASFYKLLAELEDEFYDLKRKGYEGEGFHSKGSRLHGVRVNEYEGRRRGLAAAQRRLDVQVRMGRGGVLGGSARAAGKTMREIVAEAAERRLKDDKTCNTASAADVEAEVRSAQAESVGIDAADIVHADGGDGEEGAEGGENGEEREDTVRGPPQSASGSIPPSPSASGASGTSLRTLPPNDSSKKRPASSPEVIDLTLDGASRPRRPQPPMHVSTPPKPASAKLTAPRAAPPKAVPTPPAQEWACPTCTLLNPLSAATCDACATRRPPLASVDGWFCDFCGAGPRAMEFWSCSGCGWVRMWG